MMCREILQWVSTALRNKASTILFFMEETMGQVVVLGAILVLGAYVIVRWIDNR